MLQILVRNNSGKRIAHEDRHCLAYAAQNGRFEIVKFLIEDKKFPVNIEFDGGDTPLLWAFSGNNSEEQQLEMVKCLLKYGATAGTSVLNYAIKKNKKSVVYFFLQYGVNIPSNREYERFISEDSHYGLENQQFERLFEHFGDETRDRSRDVDLFRQFFGLGEENPVHPDTVDKLLDTVYDRKKNIIFYQKLFSVARSLVSFAAGAETKISLEEFNSLLKEYNLFNLSSRDGFTLLQLAIMAGNEKCFELLLKNGVNIDAKDRDGRKAIEYLLAKSVLEPGDFPGVEKRERMLSMFLSFVLKKTCFTKADIALKENGAIPDGAEFPESEQKKLDLLLKEYQSLVKEIKNDRIVGEFHYEFAMKIRDAQERVFDKKFDFRELINNYLNRVLDLKGADTDTKERAHFELGLIFLEQANCIEQANSHFLKAGSYAKNTRFFKPIGRSTSDVAIHENKKLKLDSGDSDTDKPASMFNQFSMIPQQVQEENNNNVAKHHLNMSPNPEG